MKYVSQKHPQMSRIVVADRSRVWKMPSNHKFVYFAKNQNNKRRESGGFERIAKPKCSPCE